MVETAAPTDADILKAQTRPDESLPGGFRVFFAILATMALIRFVLGFVSLPNSALFAVNLTLAVVFMAAAILAEFFGANSKWNLKAALIFLISGVVVHIAFALLSGLSAGAVSGIANAVAQIGLSSWCVGLGALLGIYLRDKNLLIPVSIFGAAYDFYLVIAPRGAPAAGLTRHIVQSAPRVFTNIAAQVPAVSSHGTTGRAIVGSYVGPADLVFLAAFFIIVFRFKMNARLTLAIMAPVLILYMLAVLIFGIPLPALVPIGACIVVANWKHFNLKRDEWIATGAVAVLCAAFLTWGYLHQGKSSEQQAEPSTQASGQATSGSEARPAPTNSSPQNSPSPTAQGNTPNPR